MRIRIMLLSLSATICVAFGTRAAPPNPPRAPTATSAASHRVIVKLRSASNAARSSTAREQLQSAPATEEVAALAARNNLTLGRTRSILPGLHVMEIVPQSAGQSLQASLARLRADTAVEYAEPDQRRYITAAPNDPLYLATSGATGQWYLQTSGSTPSAVDAIDAWSNTTGSNGLVIADIDTGVRFDHPDLLRAGAGGRLLPGYTFISDVLSANDGALADVNQNAIWDADASDAGDWITDADKQTSEFSSCAVSNSSWHGTRVVGILGAITNNNAGIAGLTWSGWILPVRALGKCGGADSDIETAMLWAAGLAVTDDTGAAVPMNPYPANIINLSLGGTGNCPSSYIDVMNQLNKLGVTVVAAAGNEGGPVDAPGNCPHAIAVAGLRQVGTKVGFSSLGPEIALSAPGGNCVNTSGACLFSIDTTTNLGVTTPGPTPASNSYTNQSNINVGTSFATPLVAGIAGLMLSVNGNLTPAEIAARLKEGATTPFPVSSDVTVPICHVPTGSSDLQAKECNCTTQTCGAGMANANGAVIAALRPIAALKPPSSVTGGQHVVLDASGSAAACTHSVASYAWSINGSGSFVGATNGSTATVVAPTSGSFTVQVVVTDDAGKSDTAQVVLTSSTAQTTAPALAGSKACLAAITPTLPISVTVSPSSATVPAGGAAQSFTATVTSAAPTVTWEVNGVRGGNSAVGTISNAGVYTSPTNAPSSPTVSVIAVAVANPAMTGFAGVTVSSSSSGGSSGSSSSGSSSSSSSGGSSGSSSSSSSSGSGSSSGSAPSSSASHGGGGAMNWVELLLLAALATLAVAARRRLPAPSKTAQRRSTALLSTTMTLTLLGAASVAFGDSRWVAGVHYFVINPAQPTGLPAGKIEVTEVFSYACPGCNRFYPVADRLQASLPTNAVMDYLPASFRPDEDWPMFQRAYCAAQELGIDKRTHDAMFDAVWKSGELAVFDSGTQRAKRPAPTITDAAKFYAQAAGVKPETFIATAMSFAVDVRIRQAEELIRNYGISETPSIVVNGKYRLNPVSAGGYEETIELVKWLVAQETRAGNTK
jgi:serine protease